MFIANWIVAAAMQGIPCQPFPPASSPDWQVCADKVLSEAQAKPTVGDVLSRGLGRLRGRPASAAFAKIGYPDKKMTIGADTIYSWQNLEPDRGGGGNLTCTVKVIVRRGSIVGTDFHGNSGPCEMYARAFDPTFRL